MTVNAGQATQTDGLANNPHSSTLTKVALRGLTKTFRTKTREVEALSNVDLDVYDKEFLCLVGPSGCGKSTLLRILAGLEARTGGELAIVHADPARPLSSMVFQEQSAFPWMDVVQNIGYGLRARGVGRKERARRVQEFVEKVGLDGFEKAHPHELSGGMRQRVSVARAFANDPEMLLMDEPFGSLDEQLKFVLQEELMRIWEEEHKTVLFVTHSIEEAVALGDRVAVFGIRPGRIKEIVEVPISRPRDVMAIRTSPAFLETISTIWELLRDEVSKAYDPHAYEN